MPAKLKVSDLKTDPVVRGCLARIQVKALHEKYRPASQEAAQLRDRLAELDQEAEKRRAALGKADDVAALLAALEKLS